MTLPVYKIETLTGAVLDHTIDDSVFSIYTKEALTEQIGHFNIVLPLKKGDVAVYNDIVNGDKVKFYFGYGTVDATASFIGYVDKIVAPIKTPAGFVRQLSGFSQGSVLLNRLKKNTLWQATEVDDIVDDVADDLGLGKDFVVDATSVNIEVDEKTYFDLLRDVSDYYDGGGNVTKDFFVDVGNNLVWKTRPIRSAGVETLTVGKNLLDPVVTRTSKPVRNSIVVKGAAEAYWPRDRDAYTEPANPPVDWTADQGTIAQGVGGAAIVGTNPFSIVGVAGAPTISEFKREDIGADHLDGKITTRDINKVHVYSYINAAATADGPEFRLLAPNEANNFMARMSTVIGSFVRNEFSMGPIYEYDATTNPDGIWTLTGSPNWYDIKGVEIYADFLFAADFIRIDGLYFSGDRWCVSAAETNAGSITSYRQRDLHVIENKIHSDADCTARAKTLLYQLKDETIQIDALTNGNTNIIVGDRLSMTIPSEGITAQNYDVLSVEHSFTDGGFTTHAIMVNSANTRLPVERGMKHLNREIRRLATNIRDIR